MRLVRAEILKLRKRRGLMAWAALLTVGSVLIAYGVLIALHAANPAKHGPAGGADNLDHLVWLLANLGGVAAVLIGATTGSQDRASGVFRELVVTGRSRRRIFDVRVPGALAVYLPFLAAGYGAVVAGSYVFAGSSTTSSLHDVVQYGIAVAALDVVTLVLAVSLGSMIPSRIATGVLIGWNSILAGLLLSFTTLGSARKAIDVAAATHFAPSAASRDTTIAMSSGTAVLVLAIWVAVALRAGAWWTKRLDA